MNYNYHTHTYRCHHAKGTDEEFVLAAIEAGYDEIGFADHCAWPFKRFVSGMRMTADEVEEYASSVKSLAEKYKDKISVKLGFECEYFEKYFDWMKDTLKKYEFDYIILGHHFCGDEKHGTYNGDISKRKDVERYKNDVCKAMESGMFAYVAHPDIYLKGYGKFDDFAEDIARQIISKSNETGVPIEYNLLGLEYSIADGRTGYPHSDFWKLAGEMKATAVIGIDAHKPAAYLNRDFYLKAIKTLEEYGVTFTDKIKFLR